MDGVFPPSQTRQVVAVACFYVALTLLLTYPFSLQLGTHVLSAGTDMDLAVWNTGWNVHAFTHRPWAIFDANIFYPFHNTLAYTENLIGPSMIAAPVVWLTGNVVLGMNVSVLFTVAVSGLGTFLLGRRLGLSVPAALMAGVMFAFGPSRFFRMEQLPISSIQWIPFALIALHAYFDSGRARHLRIAIALFSLQAINSGHGTAMLTLAVAMLLFWKWRTGTPVALMTRAKDVGWQGALALVPAVLIYIPYKMAQVEVGLKRALDDWSVAPSSFFASPTTVHSWLISVMPDFRWLKGEPDAYLFPGILPLLLGAYAVWHQWNQATASEHTDRGWRRLAWLVEMLAVAFGALAVYVWLNDGLRLRVNGKLVLTSSGATPWIQFAVVVIVRLALAWKAPIAILARVRHWFASLRLWRRSLNTPDHLWLYASLFLMGLWLALPPPIGVWRVLYWMPGLNFVRVPSRFMVVGYLGLSLVAAMGFDRLTIKRSAGVRLAAAAIGIALLVGEFWAVPRPTVKYAPDVAPIDEWVGQQPGRMPLLDLPMSDSDKIQNREEWSTRIMLHSMAHYQPIFVGFSGIQPPGYMKMYWTFVNFPDAASIALARDIGLTHVILHGDLVPEGERDAMAAKYEQFKDDVTLVHSEGEGRFYAIRPAGAGR